MNNIQTICASVLLFERTVEVANVLIGDDGYAEVVLPVLYETPLSKYRFPMRKLNARDTRKLIIIDADFPCGALSRSCTVIDTRELGDISVPLENIHRPNPHEIDGPYYEEVDGCGVQTMYRHVLLSHSTTFAACRYKQNLCPRYVLVQVELSGVQFIFAKY